ncbi:MAG: LysM peptidoglycan-binding domain-containing protein [Roseimicrobium sp.]
MSPLGVLHRSLLVLFIATRLAAAPLRYAVPDYTEHRVQRGETLWRIAQSHKTSVGAIMDFNRLPNEFVRENMILRIPSRAVVDERTPRQFVHVVQNRETLLGIARHYNIDLEALVNANPTVFRIHEGMELIIPAWTQRQSVPINERPLVPQPSSLLTHVVTEEDTYYSLGRRYGVSMDSIASVNPTVRPERLRPGMKILVPSKNTSNKYLPSPNPPNNVLRPKPKPVPETPRRRNSHTVTDEDSLASITARYGVTTSALLKENNLDEDDIIYVGDTLKIPDVTTKRREPVAPEPPPPPSRPAPTKKTPANTVASNGTIPSYIVSDGENETTICDAFGISKQQLYEYNRLSPETKLKVGDEIAIPRVATGRKR